MTNVIMYTHLPSGRVFALVDGNGVYIYTYEARLQCSPRWPGMRLDSVSEQTMSLANDTLACRDSDNEKGASTAGVLRDPRDHTRSCP